MLPRAKGLLGAEREPGKEPMTDTTVLPGQPVMDAFVAPSEAAQPCRHRPRLPACGALRGQTLL